MNPVSALQRETPHEIHSAPKDVMAVQLFTLFNAYRRLVIAFCIAGLALSSLAALLMGPSYTATAVILPTFRSAELLSRDAPLPMVDATMLLESQVRLLKSQPISRSVAEQQAKSQSTETPSAIDAIASELANKRQFTYQRRTYLIELSFTASTPEIAADYANAVASQFVHDEQQKKLADRSVQAQRALNELSVTFGDQHPSILRARNELDEMRAFLNFGKEFVPLLGARDLEATGLVKAAQAESAKQNSRMALIFSGLILGLLAAIGIVLYVEREIVRRNFSRWFALR